MAIEFGEHDLRLGQVTVRPGKDIDLEIDDGLDLKTVSLYSEEIPEAGSFVTAKLEDEEILVELKVGSKIRQYEKIAIIAVGGLLVTAGVVKAIHARHKREFQN